MRKLVLMFTVLVSLTGFSFAAAHDGDVLYLIQNIREVERELGYRLVITSTYRSWEEQIGLMWNKDVSTLNTWYGADVASAFIKYKNGELEKEALIEVMDACPYIKHPKGLAVDIGVNSSGLSPYQVEEVKKALERKGLYVFDERSDNEPCIHVSRSKK